LQNDAWVRITIITTTTITIIIIIIIIIMTVILLGLQNTLEQPYIIIVREWVESNVQKRNKNKLKLVKTNKS